MRSWIDGHSDLNVRILKEDLPELLKGKTIRQTITTYDRRSIGILLRLGDTEGKMRFLQLPKDSLRKDVRKYDVTLNRAKFQQHVAEVDAHPNTEDAPFWARGIEYDACLDRIHIHYVNV